MLVAFLHKFFSFARVARAGLCASITACVLLAACGQRGPLTVPPKPPPGYIPPDQRQPQTPPAPTREEEAATRKS